MLLFFIFEIHSVVYYVRQLLYVDLLFELHEKPYDTPLNYLQVVIAEKEEVVDVYDYSVAVIKHIPKNNWRLESGNGCE